MKLKSTLTLESLRHHIKEALAESYRPESYSYLLEEPDLLDEASILKNKHPFKALYIFGPAGAGKTHIKNHILGVPGDFKTSNPDERIESVFPTFGISMKFANSEAGDDAELEDLQQTSRKILQGAERAHVANLISIANPLIFDTTGEEVPKQAEKIKALNKLGYDIAVMLINVPTEASVERDTKRKRTVGQERTTTISKDYQEAVVQHRGYYKALKGLENVTMLTDDVYNNIFDLKTGELLTMPTVITPEMLPPELDPNQNPDAFKGQKALMDQAVGRMKKWATSPVQNPKGQILLKGMRALVKKSGGKLGQNMNQLVIAMAKPEFQEDEEILAAARHLSELGGASVVMKKRKHGDERDSAGASEDAPYLQHAIRGKKDVGDATVRGKERKYSYPGLTGAKDAMGPITKEPPRQRTYKKHVPEGMNYDDLVEMIREVVANSS